MKLKTKRLIDHYLGSICIICLSFGVRFLGLMLRRNHEPLPVDSILILKFQGIGSLAIALPAIKALRSRFKSSKIVFWGTPSTCLLAKEMDEFDEIIELDDRSFLRAIGSTLLNLYRIHRIKFDWMADLEVYSKLSVILGTLTLSRNRAGFAVDSVRLRCFNHTHLVFFNRHQYLGKAYERLLGLINTKDTLSEDPEDKPFQEHFLKHCSSHMESGENYIVINPNAGELSFERRWSIECFNQLIKKLLKHYKNYSIVIIGSGKNERRYCERLNKCSRIINRVNCLPLLDTIQCIVQGKLLISNDSAPLHLGLLSSVPVIGLFGPTSPMAYVDKKRPRTHIHYGEIYCSPCIHYWDTTPCKGRNQCMRAITVKQVFLSCVELLDDEGSTEFTIIQGGGRNRRGFYYPGLIYSKDDV